MKYKTILFLLFFSIAAMADTALIIKPLQGNEQAQALAEIGYAKMTNDSIFIYSHTDYLLSKTAMQNIRHIRYGEATDTPTGNANDLTTTVRLYPNPTQNMLLIDNADCQTAYIFDLSGHLLQTTNLQGASASINVSSLPIGEYLLLLNSQTYKFLKQ